MGGTLWDLATGEPRLALPTVPTMERPRGRRIARTANVACADMFGARCSSMTPSRNGTSEPRCDAPDCAGHGSFGDGRRRFSPDGGPLVTSASGGKVRSGTRPPGKSAAACPASPKGPTASPSAPDSHLLAVGAGDNTSRLWDVRTPEPLAILNVGNPVYGLAFSPDGTRLAAGCRDNTIRLIDVATRQEVAELRGHTDYVHAVAWSPDGTRLVSGSGDPRSASGIRCPRRSGPGVPQIVPPGRSPQPPWLRRSGGLAMAGPNRSRSFGLSGALGQKCRQRGLLARMEFKEWS